MILADQSSVEFENQTYPSNRRFYLSIVADWEQIETKKAWLG
ncbi:MAG: hypothetical protein ACI9DK_000577 [Vicingaceae bacterium]|jgi:hypothetical protein